MWLSGLSLLPNVQSVQTRQDMFQLAERPRLGQLVKQMQGCIRRLRRAASPRVAVATLSGRHLHHVAPLAQAYFQLLKVGAQHAQLVVQLPPLLVGAAELAPV